MFVHSMTHTVLIGFVFLQIVYFFMFHKVMNIIMIRMLEICITERTIHITPLALVVNTYTNMCDSVSVENPRCMNIRLVATNSFSSHWAPQRPWPRCTAEKERENKKEQASERERHRSLEGSCIVSPHFSPLHYVWGGGAFLPSFAW